MKFCKYCILEEHPLSVTRLRGLLASSFQMSTQLIATSPAIVKAVYCGYIPKTYVK
ncbi:hypothetical protein [Anabaena catenula]|uniref:hypothetical protein n=1 Tax=Anabaena catenula TaxID=1296320 RepID=UPI001A7EE410|nr:hypothetical protein [Anabaena catenula]